MGRAMTGAHGFVPTQRHPVHPAIDLRLQALATTGCKKLVTSCQTARGKVMSTPLERMQGDGVGSFSPAVECIGFSMPW